MSHLRQSPSCPLGPSSRNYCVLISMSVIHVPRITHSKRMQYHSSFLSYTSQMSCPPTRTDCTFPSILLKSVGAKQDNHGKPTYCYPSQGTCCLSNRWRLPKSMPLRRTGRLGCDLRRRTGYRPRGRSPRTQEGETKLRSRSVAYLRIAFRDGDMQATTTTAQARDSGTKMGTQETG